ncbi:hypothetical protein ACIPVK_02665 [Paeniglutamicibacter sp. MACA_103]|uniref:hypothetical protein n=1 Tax=Paeniglutamicibacter sp. MACA_103 TaxID=3377337 RepID=UPI0038953000
MPNSPFEYWQRVRAERRAKAAHRLGLRERPSDGLVVHRHLARLRRPPLAGTSGGLTAVMGAVLLVSGQPDYVDRFAPVWAPLVGGILVILASASVRFCKPLCVLATVFLGPPAVALVFHLLRAVGAIPFPVDLFSMLVSLAATVTIIAAWLQWSPLRTGTGFPLETPRWIALLGITVALIYPGLKTLWVAGGTWLAPAGSHSVDGAYLAPVALAVMGTAATAVALRWWRRDAPRWAHPTAAAGGLTLIGLGTAGLHSSLAHASDEGPLLGVLVYGGWLIWGLATLGVAARLSHRRTDPHRTSSTVR